MLTKIHFIVQNLDRTMRRTVFLFAIAGSAIFSLQLSEAAPWSDVYTTSEVISYLQERKIIRNNPSSDLRLGDPIARSEALAAVIRSREKFSPQLLWFSKNLPAISLFTDTDQSLWYAPYIEVAFLEGIMTGYPDGTFRPGATLTTEQALTTLQRAYTWKGGTEFHTSNVLQNREGQWYTDAVSEAIARNLIPETLHLGSPMTRGQFFEMLYRTHITDQRREYAFDEQGTEGAKGTEGTDVSADFKTSVPLVPSVPSVPLSLLPLRITPLPFQEEDSFVIRLPSTQKKAQRLPSSSTVYASRKPFAITIPTLGIIDFTVAHPADPFSDEGILEPLGEGLGHLFSYPGQLGKSMIYGHSSSWPWDRSDYARAFRQVNTLAMGDRVYVTYDSKLYVYEVTRKQIVAASDTSPYSDDGREELILYTCWPPDTANDSRYLVHALPVETVALQ